MKKIGKYINPFTDFGFKKLFGTEFNKDLLIDFLNEVLGDREKIKDLRYLNTEKLGKNKQSRKSVFDLYCENEKGETFIIELQNIGHKYFKDRSIYYATFPIQEQALKGKEWDYYLKSVHTICILNFGFEDEEDIHRYYREIKLLDTQTYKVFYDRLSFYYLEVPRFAKTEEELETNFDKWMYVLKNLHQLEKIPKALQNKIFKKLFNEAETAHLTPEEMKAYEQSLKDYWDEYSILKSAKELAKEEGKLEGKLEGKDERNHEIALMMKKNGEPIEKISKYTGLSKEEIEKL
ncbi:MAG: Rpn family recombination-promoting nuclease/putative transposase [Microscillaceae bacterium]|nr:Rpn family recombination-promoting nuclease/putative transposase [Microscillaceae bacterium]